WAEVVTVEGGGGARRCVDIGGKHAPLQLAEILRARDDLLARVAALVEAHAADQLEVRHLGDELVLRGSGDQGKTPANVQPAPQRRILGMRVLQYARRSFRGEREEQPSVGE